MRNVAIVLLVGAVLYLAGIDMDLAALSRWVVATIVSALEVPVQSTSEEVRLGNVVLTWTEACSGVSALIVLLGIAAWTGRRECLGPFLIRVLLCFPLALAANVCRILILAGLRYLLAPHWEGEQLHFFVGFICVLPFLPILAKDFRDTMRQDWLKLGYLAVVLALLSVQVSAPGGVVVVACTILCVFRGALQQHASRQGSVANMLWASAALPIAWGRMESLWIPWVLCCPQFVERRFLASPSGVVILAGTVPVIAMHWPVQALVLVAQVYLLVVRQIGTPEPSQETAATGISTWQSVILLGSMMFPFALPELVGFRHPVETPPPGLMVTQAHSSGYAVRAAGQPNDIVVYWYGGHADGRHHRLSTCLRFRGVRVEPVSGEENVLLGNRKWMREFFLHGDKLLVSYLEYLLSSLLPLSPPGVHIVVQAPSNAMDHEYFAQESRRLVGSIFESYVDSKSPCVEQSYGHSDQLVAGNLD